nr:GNAT family N-acetyltransferase [Actinomadura barringtoniae]
MTKRANSVLPVGAPGAPIDRAIERVEGAYGELGLPAAFQLSAASRPEGLDEVLAGRGYDVVDPTLAMAAELDDPGPQDDVMITTRPSQEWKDVWWSVDGRGDDAALAMAERILTGVPAGYAVLDGVAVGRGVPQGEWLGVYAMAVLPEARRRGLARQVLRALMAWGYEQGCRKAYLVVVEANAAARALYESAGFRNAGGYHYRVRRQ